MSNIEVKPISANMFEVRIDVDLDQETLIESDEWSKDYLRRIRGAAFWSSLLEYALVLFPFLVVFFISQNFFDSTNYVWHISEWPIAASVLSIQALYHLFIAKTQLIDLTDRMIKAIATSNALYSSLNLDEYRIENPVLRSGHRESVELNGKIMQVLFFVLLICLILSLLYIPLYFSNPEGHFARTIFVVFIFASLSSIASSVYAKVLDTLSQMITALETSAEMNVRSVCKMYNEMNSNNPQA